MTVEVATFITDLQPVNPPATDPRSQGDDHLRLIKQVLQNTFPTGTKAIYPPSAAVSTGGAALTLTVANQNTIQFLDTTTGNITVTLPSLAAANAGWFWDAVKTSTDANAATVSAASGNIGCQFGSVTSIRVGAVCAPARFIWSGTAWFCTKMGPMVGSTEVFDGPALPAGYLTLDGSAFSGTTFAELAAAIGGTTLRDKRGRLDIGAGTGTGLTARVNGTLYGGETVTLGTANLPPYTPAGSVPSVTVNSNVADVVRAPNGVNSSNAGGGALNQLNAGSLTAQITSTGSGTFSGSAQGGTSTPFGIIPPSIGSQKIIRAC
jgi:hypothetical protein